MLLGVTGVSVERQVGRMAVMKLGVPDIFVIDEENRERAVRNVSDCALAVCKVRELGPTMLIGVNVRVLEEEHDDFVTGLVVDVHLFAFMLVGAHDAGEREGEGGGKGNGKKRMTQSHR
jgi:hypothetical protein